MGCDIHMHYEIRDGKVWKFHDWKAAYADGTYEDGGRRLNYKAIWEDPLDVGRNYNLFAVLAGVRNGIGFAGCYTGEPFRVIAEPRGVPCSASKEVKAENKKWNVDGHSHSWLTLEEVMDFDYEQTREASGVVDPAEFAVFVEKGKPDEWSGDVMGRNICKISPQQMLEYHCKGYPQDGRTYYTRVTWKETYRDAIGPQWFATMQALADKFGRKNVRLVFWFDN